MVEARSDQPCGKTKTVLRREISGGISIGKSGYKESPSELIL